MDLRKENFFIEIVNYYADKQTTQAWNIGRPELF